MGRTRKTIEPEIIQPEDDQPKRGRKQMVEAEHTIKYSAPVPVTVEETPEESEIDLLDIEEEGRPRRKPVKSERDELRKKLAVNGVTPGSNLKLAIERYRHSESAESGMWAETESCTNYACDEAHITSDAYLDVARKFGTGRFRFTLRMNNKIVTAWDKWITAPIHNPLQVMQPSIPGDPTSPQVVVQMPNQPGVITDPKKILKEHLEMTKLFREAYGVEPAASDQARSEEEVLASAILKQPEVIENVVGSVMKRFGSSGGKDDEPWYADVVRDAVKSGQGAQIVKTAIDGIFNGLSGLFPKGQNNGQAQMAQTPQTAPHVAPTDAQSLTTSDQQAPVIPSNGDPYVEMLTRVITQMSNNVPVEEAVKIVNGFLLINPAYAETIDSQFSMEADTLLGAIATLPGCEQITQAQHAKQWIEQFQSAFFDEEKEHSGGGKE